ncbi:hypothetical protein [Deinococcus sp. QL22]|uniref:hypothetical protein n=1 Tax=Deinococcus sp. QL22 TaxID=2939437 RepID=UPI0020178624|nr:hypothetical protein [Deinococcus sp. QL22]UQN06555.1 hypothetical protein M1R55_01140 [Deinococcus sp. QL22]
MTDQMMTQQEAALALCGLLATLRSLGIQVVYLHPEMLRFGLGGQGWVLLTMERGGRPSPSQEPYHALARIAEAFPELVAPHVPGLLQEGAALMLALTPGSEPEPERALDRLLIAEHQRRRGT